MVIERTLSRPVVDVVRAVLVEKRIQIATVVGHERIADGLEVLLRHRRRSISRRSAAFHARRLLQQTRFQSDSDTGKRKAPLTRGFREAPLPGFEPGFPD